MASKAHEQGRSAGYAQSCGTVSAATWTAYMASCDGERDWLVEMADFKLGFAEGVATWKAEHPYVVLGFGSHPDSESDDCYTGAEFATLAEARDAFLGTNDCSVAFIMLDGPDVNEIRANPNYRASRRSDDGEWRREFAMQNGMAFGCVGYNDAMGV